MLHEVCASLPHQQDNTPFVSEGVVGLNTAKIERDAMGATSVSKIAKKEKALLAASYYTYWLSQSLQMLIDESIERQTKKSSFTGS